MPERQSGFKGTVLVSAGASGIGRAIAETFLRNGAAVHVCDLSADALDEFLATNPGATGTVADVADPGHVDMVYKELREQHNGLDVLVNNAGIAGPTAPLEEIDVADWQRCIEVDLNGIFYMTRHAVPLLKEAGGGSIISIASNAALFGLPLRSPYVAAKWAQIGLTKTWAMELGKHGIRVNSICPGSVDGDRIERVIRRDAAERGVPEQHIRDVYLRQSSLRTFVSKEDIADMALFLASDRGARISGQSIAIDGHTETLSNWLD